MEHLKFVSKEITPITREQQCNNVKFVLTIIIINILYKIQIGTSYYIFRIFGGNSGLTEIVNINNFQYKYSWNE